VWSGGWFHVCVSRNRTGPGGPPRFCSTGSLSSVRSAEGATTWSTPPPKGHRMPRQNEKNTSKLMPYWDPRGTHCAFRGKCAEGGSKARRRDPRKARKQECNDGLSAVGERSAEINNQAIPAILALSRNCCLVVRQVAWHFFGLFGKACGRGGLRLFARCLGGSTLHSDLASAMKALSGHRISSCTVPPQTFCHSPHLHHSLTYRKSQEISEK